MLYSADANWEVYITAHGATLYLLAYFALVPALSVPVRLGGYGTTFNVLLRTRVGRSTSKLNCLSTLLAYLCSAFVGMAAIPIMMASLSSALEDYPLRNEARFMSVSATYGYVMPLLWTPVSGVVGIVLHSLGLEWAPMFAALFLISVGGLIINWLIFYFLEGRRDKACDVFQDNDVSESPVHYPIKHLLQMVLGIVLLTGIMATLDVFLDLGLILIASFIAIPFALTWCAFMGEFKRGSRGISQQILARLPNMTDLFVVFLSAGFFIEAMEIADYSQQANDAFLFVRDSIGTKLLLLSLPLLAIISAFLGVHPLVAIVLLGESLQPDVLGISAQLLAVYLIGSTAITYMLGPFSGTLGLVQSITNIPTYRLAFWNAPYAFGYFILISAVILAT